MRKAEIDRAWERCREERSVLFMLGMECQSPAPYSVRVVSRISAVVGPNGVGKTRLLRGILRVLNGDAPSASPVVSIDGSFRGRLFTAGAGRPAPESLAYDLIDVSAEAHAAIRYFTDQNAFEELRDQFAEVPISGESLDIYRYVCRRNYSALSIREIDAPTVPSVADEAEAEEEVLPFFEVQADGLTYDSRTMGFGELCACHLLWRLQRAPSGSFIFFDEPDSHLSSLARTAFLDVLAVMASNKKLVALLSSHSGEVLNRLKEDEIFLIAKPQVVAEPLLTAAGDRRDVMRKLGLSAHAKILVAVEDVDAAEVMRQILNRFANGLDRFFDIQVVRGGASEVVRLASIFPPDANSVRVVAALDGDKRSTYPSVERVLFLPGSLDPVAEGIRAARANPGALAFALGIDETRMIPALDNAELGNHHDFCANLIHELGISATVATVRTALMQKWLEQPTTDAEGRQLCAELMDLLKAIPID